MNTILQKRIEEAAREYLDSRRPDWDVNDLELVKGAYRYLLSNQWISVEEALPEFQQDVVVTNSEGDYWTAWRSNESCEHKDNNGFVNYGIGEITHWMAIPQLKGGEK